MHTQNTYTGVCFRIGSDLITSMTEKRTAEPTVVGPLEAKSGKQKNVTKSSTEAELVALSDHAGRVINLRNFLAGQGYGVVPVIISVSTRTT